MVKKIGKARIQKVGDVKVMAVKIILIVFGVMVALFSAYTKSVQETTKEIEKKLAQDDPSIPVGIQDAITPDWQPRNNLLLMGGMFLFVIGCFYFFRWYFAIPVFFATFIIGMGISSIFILPKPMSKKMISKIRKNLEARLVIFQKAGDEAGYKTMKEIVRRFDKIIVP